MKVVVLGLSITSSWGNGHATTYRGLLRELALRGHEVQFLERDVPWYADNRDVRELPGIDLQLYANLDELKRHHSDDVRDADAVIVGSYVQEGIAVGRWVQQTATGVTAFYDIDTPVTLASLRRGGADYISGELIPHYRLYLSFTGGPTLAELEHTWGSPAARPLYCAVDPRDYFPEEQPPTWDLGYIGTYSRDRQPSLETLLLRPARQLPSRRFIVAGPQYPANTAWPANVERIEHLPPSGHRRFYNQQRFTLNITRADMIAAGWSPRVRLFEAAACGTPIVSDCWPGLEEFFVPGREILLATSSDDVRRLIEEVPASDAAAIGDAARRRVLAHHTAAHRAMELELHLMEATREVRSPMRTGSTVFPSNERRRAASSLFAQ
ncbi:MAG TPA: glycosyltransferase [Opitutus sp.]|nr:glycosyltransferase [Opitutus sp.]